MVQGPRVIHGVRSSPTTLQQLPPPDAASSADFEEQSSSVDEAAKEAPAQADVPAPVEGLGATAPADQVDITGGTLEQAQGLPGANSPLS